jgi:hypothetical protein
MNFRLLSSLGTKPLPLKTPVSFCALCRRLAMQEIDKRTIKVSISIPWTKSLWFEILELHQDRISISLTLIIPINMTFVLYKQHNEVWCACQLLNIRACWGEHTSWRCHWGYELYSLQTTLQYNQNHKSNDKIQILGLFHIRIWDTFLDILVDKWNDLVDVGYFDW